MVATYTVAQVSSMSPQELKQAAQALNIDSSNLSMEALRDKLKQSVFQIQDLSTLKTKYEASKTTYASAKDDKNKYNNIYLEAQAKYGASNPDEVNSAQVNFKKYDEIYKKADRNNDDLNLRYFDAILKAGQMNYVA